MKFWIVAASSAVYSWPATFCLVWWQRGSWFHLLSFDFLWKWWARNHFCAIVAQWWRLTCACWLSALYQLWGILYCCVQSCNAWSCSWFESIARNPSVSSSDSVPNSSNSLVALSFWLRTGWGCSICSWECEPCGKELLEHCSWNWGSSEYFIILLLFDGFALPARDFVCAVFAQISAGFALLIPFFRSRQCFPFAVDAA